VLGGKKAKRCFEKNPFLAGFSFDSGAQDDDVLFGRDFARKDFFFGKSVSRREPGDGGVLIFKTRKKG
jgi:hypothetical protein